MVDRVLCCCPNCDSRFELLLRAEAEPVGEKPTLFIDADGIAVICPCCGYQEIH